jgi:hypothetical protein
MPSDPRACRKCKRDETEVIFVGHSPRHNICKSCHNEVTKEWRRANPKKALEIKKGWKKRRPDLQAAQQKRWYAKHHIPKLRKPKFTAEELRARAIIWRNNHPEVGTLVQCQRRARRKKFECTITAAWIKKHTGTHCSDFPWIEFKRGQKVWCDSSPSVDRKDSTKGYNQKNSRVVSMLANRLKGKRSMGAWLPIRDQIRTLYKVCSI